MTGNAMRMKAAALLALLVFAPDAGAQDPGVTPLPSRPAQELFPGTGNEGFAAWARKEFESGHREAPIVVQGGRFEVLALSPLAALDLARDEALAPIVAACGPQLQIADADRAELIASDPWEAFDRAAAREPTFSFTIVPVQAVMADCGAGELARHAALARGIRFGRQAFYNASNDALRAQLWVNGAAVEPVLAGRASVTQVAQARVMQDGTAQVRLFVLPSMVAPTVAGRMPQVELWVWNAKDAVPDRIPVPVAVLRRLWDAELRWRAERIANGAVVAIADGRPVLPMPRDTVLRFARSRLDAGDHRAAAVASVDRLRGGDLAGEDLRIGRLQLAFAFDAEGETDGARVVVADALSEDPCLSFAAGTGARFVRMLDAGRPPARCTSVPLAKVALFSVVPGMGQLAGRRRTGMAFAVAATTVGGLVLASTQHAQARELHTEYNAITGFEALEEIIEVRVRDYYVRAQRKRDAANTMAAVAIGAWVVGGIEAVLAEHWHAKSLRAADGYGRPPVRLGLVPLDGARGLGLTLTFF